MGGSTAHSRNSDATSRQKCVAAARYMFCFGAYITTLQQFNYLNPMMSTLWMMACSVIKLLAVRWLDHEELNSCLEDAIGASKIFAHGDILMSHQLTNLKKLKTQCFSTDMRRPDEHPKSEQSFKYCFRHFWHSVNQINMYWRCNTSHTILITIRENRCQGRICSLCRHSLGLNQLSKAKVMVLKHSERT
ncbi:hypothetical protein B0H13DRAFT_417469 [Mycena leptocephala]|nr:hypothetical protein B0H13DRAFT_417469 [Mycena leptocephala]